ncbi:hypothetical protein BZG02_17370 [Labilibaculum filiforme]|uniref:Cupin n=1 Tax=Labilibaculum filiforme TaxID=1940526 RepID=A0A2N3HSA0_9BACT|nr:hypothetical protein [Labilibaculum filiforme]PKQ60919.1 hypothetical protein BZG02_17370 [Labilibaculum filiforme]
MGDLKLMQEYAHKGEGFSPLYISGEWQVAQINYAPNQAIGSITSIDIHFKTDELFVLLKGTAILIAAIRNDGKVLSFETTLMKQGVVYNIPKMVWHNIALEPTAEVLIFEDKNSHLGEYEIVDLSLEEQKSLTQQLKKTIFDNTQIGATK